MTLNGTWEASNPTTRTVGETEVDGADLAHTVSSYTISEAEPKPARVVECGHMRNAEIEARMTGALDEIDGETMLIYRLDAEELTLISPGPGGLNAHQADYRRIDQRGAN